MSAHTIQQNLYTELDGIAATLYTCIWEVLVSNLGRTQAILTQVLISVSGCVDPRVVVRLEGLDQLKRPITSSGIEPATFRLVA
jgi:hypothetical protein